MALADQPADVELALGAHLGRPGVAEVELWPTGRPGGLAPLAAEVTGERVEGVGHMAVAEEAAHRVRAVRAVANDIMVRPGAPPNGRRRARTGW